MKLFALWPTGPDGGVTVVVAHSEDEAKKFAINVWDGEPFYNGATDWTEVSIIQNEIVSGVTLCDRGMHPSFVVCK